MIQWSYYLLSGFFIFVFSGCHSEWQTDQYYGTRLAGNFSINSSDEPGKNEPSLEKAAIPTLFSIQMLRDSKDAFTFRFTHPRGQTLFEASAFHLKRKSFDLSFLGQTYHLKRISKNFHSFTDSWCYGYDSAPKSIVLCAGKQDFYFKVEGEDKKIELEVAGGVFERDTFEYEEPRSLTLSEAVKIGVNKNFLSLIEYEHTIQAGNQALAAQFNLAPHVRFSNAAAVFMQATPPLIGGLGDFLPFLFPSRWFQAKQKIALSQAAQYGFAIMKANLVSEIHTLSFSFIYEQKRKEMIESFRQDLSELSHLANKLHEEGKIKADPCAAVESLRLALDLPEFKTKASLNTYRAALSESLGFFNPMAVKSISNDEHYPSIEKEPGEELTQLDPYELGKKGYAISLERRQLAYFKKAEGFRAKELLVSWIDPSGSPSTALGINLYPQKEISKSEQEIFQLKENLLRQKIQQIANSISEQIRASQSDYFYIKKALVAEQDRIENLRKFLSADAPLKKNLAMTANFNLLGHRAQLEELCEVLHLPETAIDTRNSRELALYQLVYTYRNYINHLLALDLQKERWDLAHARLERLLLTHAYSNLEAAPEARAISKAMPH